MLSISIGVFASCREANRNCVSVVMIRLGRFAARINSRTMILITCSWTRRICREGRRCRVSAEAESRMTCSCCRVRAAARQRLQYRRLEDAGECSQRAGGLLNVLPQVGASHEGWARAAVRR
jgi:hypothetical protein